MPRVSSALLLFFAVVCSSPAAALSARDVMEKMSKEERFYYLIGLAHMHSYHAVLAGDRPRATCIVKSVGSRDMETWKLLYDTFDRHPDKAPESIVVVVMKKLCGGQ